MNDIRSTGGPAVSLPVGDRPRPHSSPRVTIVHDYLTQRGGAERVVLSMLKAFPDAPLHTSLYHPTTTFPEFSTSEVRTLPIDRLKVLRRNHRLALPLLAPSFSRHHVGGDVVLCSSSGWAHGVQAGGRKITYCYSPARWLYDGRSYTGGNRPLKTAALGLMRPWLVNWDRRAAGTAHRVLTSSRAVQHRIKEAYGIEAELLPPPHTIDPSGPQRPVPGVDPGYFLAVSRLLPYKNLTQLLEAFATLRDQRLVIVGTGPEAARLRDQATPNVTLLGTVGDEALRWLYSHAQALVAPSFEDFGLTPLEAAAFGRPVVALRGGGFVDTVDEGTTGVFFDEPEPRAIVGALRSFPEHRWSPTTIRAHADGFSEERFIARLRQVVDEESRRG